MLNAYLKYIFYEKAIPTAMYLVDWSRNLFLKKKINKGSWKTMGWFSRNNKKLYHSYKCHAVPSGSLGLIPHMDRR